MARMLDMSKISVDNVSMFNNGKYQGMTIEWSSPDIGYGEYQFYKSHKEGSEWEIDSEHMDRGEDKEFGKELLLRFLEMCEAH